MIFYSLNLNLQSLKDQRKTVLDIALKFLIAKHPKGTWTKAILQKAVDTYTAKNKKGQLKPFCQIIIQYFNKKMQRL